MSFPLPPPCLDCWYWQAFRIRCALSPDEPRLLDQYELHARQLVAYGRLNPWRMASQVLELLLDTACDQALPWHWRSFCLDRAWRPLSLLEQLACDRPRQLRLNHLRNRLATLRLSPSLSFNEPVEGNSHE